MPIIDPLRRINFQKSFYGDLVLAVKMLIGVLSHACILTLDHVNC